MTMPHLMNCKHQEFGWCLKCVAELKDEATLAQTHVSALQQQISEMEFAIMNRARVAQSLPPEFVKSITEIKPQFNSRKDYEAHVRRTIIKDGHKPIRAKYDKGGNCTICGESGRCPGWHFISPNTGNNR